MYPNRCIGMVSPQYVSSGVSQDDYSWKKLFPINNLVWFPLTSDWYWFFSASFQRFFTHIQLYDYFLSQKCIDMASHQCVFFNVYITFCVFW